MAKPPLFSHRPRVRCTAAGRFVSSLFQGAACIGSCMQFVAQRAVGFSFHGRSVFIPGAALNPEISSIQGEGL